MTPKSTWIALSAPLLSPYRPLLRLDPIPLPTPPLHLTRGEDLLRPQS